MGSFPSSASKSKYSLNHSAAEIVRLMMPVYYTTENITCEDRELAKAVWNLVVNDTSPEYLARKGKADFHSQCCVSFFYDTFYTRLFDVHPICRPLFMHGMKSQGKFLVKMIGLALSELENENPQIFEKTLHHLAKVHYERGVKAVEYGIVGEVLFYSLRVVLGSAYTTEAHHVWIKIFCRMLHTIIPTAVYLELPTDEHHQHNDQQQHPKKVSSRDTSCSWEFSSLNNFSLSSASGDLLLPVTSDVAVIQQSHLGCPASRTIDEE